MNNDMKPILDPYEGRDVEDLMVDWPIDSESLVWDVGAFEGNWAGRINDKYHPNLCLFEPQTGSHIDRLQRRLTYRENMDRIALYYFALGDHDAAALPMGEFDTDGASFLLGEEHAKEPGNTRKEIGLGEMVDVAWFMQQQYMNVDLAAINIEGYEFTLIPYLVEKGLISRFQHLAVQFHMFADPDMSKFIEVCHLLAPTHEMIWNRFPTWVAWRRRS